MADRSRSGFVAKFLLIGFAAIVVLIIFISALSHFVKSEAVAIYVYLGLFYGCALGFLGWQIYKVKGKRDGWPSAKASARRGGLGSREVSVAEESGRKEILVSEPLVVQTTLTTKERERLDRLRRRLEWLQRRIANHHGDPGYDKSEASALEWAIRFIEDASAW